MTSQKDDTTMKNQKIIKVGNSYALTIDSDFVKRTALKVGESVLVQYNPSSASASFARPDDFAKAKKSGKLSHDEKRTVLASKITPELQEWTKDMLIKDKALLEALEKV